MFVRGIGRTKFGSSSRSLAELAYEAIALSLKDSDLKLKDIDIIYVANSLAAYFQNQTNIAGIISSLLPIKNIPIIHVESACASGGVAFFQGTLSLKNFDNVMVLGVEKMTSATSKESTDYVAAISENKYDKEEGFSYAVGASLLMQEYIKTYKPDIRVFDEISFINHSNGNLNPFAHFYNKVFTREAIASSPIVCSPLKLLHCSPNTDGAVSVIISNKKTSKRDIKIMASAMCSNNNSLIMNKDLLSFDCVRSCAQKAYKMAGIKAKQIEFAEVHDGFAVAQILLMEDLDLCKRGEAGKMILSGETSKSGRLPINPSGGLMSNGHAIGVSGLTQIYEVVKQLRKEGGKMQVNGKIGLTCNTGGFVGSCSISIFGA